MSEHITIEPAALEDAAEILKLQKLAFRSQAQLYHDWNLPPLLQTLAELQQDFQAKIFLKAVANGKIVGSVRGMARDQTGYMERLVVHPDWQNRGIGTRLVHEIEKYFPHCRRFELFTGHRSQRNINLYRKCGYKIFQRDEKPGQVPLVFMEKNIKILPENDR